MTIFAFFIIYWMHYVGRPKSAQTSLLAMAKSWFEVRASRRAYSGIKVSIWKTFDFAYALLYHSSRLRRLLRAPLIQKERFFYVCIRMKALSLIFVLQIYAFIRLYTIESVYLKAMLIQKTYIRFYTFIYVYIRMQTPFWKFSRFPIYVYIRLYTFANACLEAIDISNMRLKNDYIRLKTQESNFQNFQIYEYIRLYTF